MKALFASLSPSDFIQLFGIVASLVSGIVAIVISLATLHQNSKMLEESYRPVISIYGESLNIGEPILYVIIKNFGSSSAFITKFDYDFDFSSAYYSDKGVDFLKTLTNATIAPGQSRICALDYHKMTRPVTFNITYKSSSKIYTDKIVVDFHAGTSMLTLKQHSPGNELKNISYALQEFLQKNL